MNCTFYNFSKRRNSTAQPSGGTVKQIVLKDNCSIINPVIQLAGPTRPNYNYANLFDRYYYISDWTWIGPVWEAQLTLDYLASNKQSIVNTYAMVEYATDKSRISSAILPDPRLVVNQVSTFGEVSASTQIFNQTGCYVIGTINQSSSQANGLLTTYMLTPAQLASVAQSINSRDFLDSITEFFANPFEAIVFCRWLPLTADAYVASASSRVYISNFDTNVFGRLYSNKTYSGQLDVAIPWSSDVPNYQRTSQYTTLTIYLPYVGVVDLNPDLFIFDSAVRVQYAIDVTDGSIIYRVCKVLGSQVIATYSGACGADIPLSRQKDDIAGKVAGAFTAIGGAATAAAAIATGGTGTVIAGGIGTALAGAGKALTSSTVHTQVNGALSSRASSAFDATIVIKRYTKLTSYGARKDQTLGEPLGEVCKLGDLTGYVQTQQASVTLSDESLSGEADEVNRLLDTGIYIE